MFELAIAQLALANTAGNEATAALTTITSGGTTVTVVDGGCGGCAYGQPAGYAYPAYGYYDPYAYSYPTYAYGYPGYYDPYAGYYYSQPAYGYTYYTCAEAPAPAEQLALPVMQQLPQPKDPSTDPSPEEATVKASPGHLLLCAHAMLLGAALATQDVLSGKDDVANWGGSFKDQSNAAADSMSPVGAYVLKQHVFQVCIVGVRASERYQAAEPSRGSPLPSL